MRFCRPLAVLLPLAAALIWGFSATGARAEEGVGATAGAPSIRIRPLMLPVINARGAIEKYNQVEVTLELADMAGLPAAQTLTPRLQDIVLSEIYQAIDKKWIVRGAIVNPNALRKRLDDAAEEVLGKGTIARVLITPMSRQSSWP